MKKFLHINLFVFFSLISFGAIGDSPNASNTDGDEICEAGPEESILINFCGAIERRGACNYTPGCHWSRWRDRCVSNRDDGGHGDYRQCRSYHRPHRCERQRGCRWSYRRDRCVERY